MSTFKTLKDASNHFEEELKRLSGQIFSAKIGENFENGVAKKLQDLSLFTSKARLLRAKPMSMTPQVTQSDKDEATVLNDYGDLAASKIIERQLVKFVTQAQAVKALLTAPDRSLDPALVERKDKITKALTAYREQEALLQHLDLIQMEKENELAEVRARWDELVGELRDVRAEGRAAEQGEAEGPMYDKLRGLVDKLELMRCLICALVSPRTRGYDWMADPRRRLAALKLARRGVSVDSFLTDDC